MVKRTVRLGTVEVTADGEGLLWHAGVASLVEVADRVGLTDEWLGCVGRDAGAALGARPGAGAAGRGCDARRWRRLRD